MNQAMAIDPTWGIIGASLRSPATRSALLPQDFLYAQLVIDGAERRVEVIGSLLDCIHAPSEPALLLDRLAAPETKIVTLTVTEKGYGHVPATGDLDMEAIKEDIDDPRRPSTALGVVAEGLRRRKEASLDPFVVMSCDNLAGNGRVLRRVLVQYCGLFDPALAEWIEGEVAFPCTMVDRITPASKEGDRKIAAELLGLWDESPVPTEAFSQWVIESFDGEQPPWDGIGVEVVDDIGPHENIKLRVLNSAHFAMAFIGFFLGHRTVHEVTLDAVMQGFVRRMLIDEAKPTLSRTGSVDVETYVESTLGRFRNEGIVHLLSQIRMDGSRKIGPRILDPLRENLGNGHPSPCLEMTVAAWLSSWHLHFRDGIVMSRDPHEEVLTRRWKEEEGDLGRFIKAALGDKEIFGDLGSSEELAGKIAQAGIGLVSDPKAALSRLPCRGT